MALSEEEFFPVSRPVSLDDYKYIDEVIVDVLKIPRQQKSQLFGRNVALLRRRELYLEMQRSGVLDNDPAKNVRTIFEPAPESTLAPIEVGIDSVNYFGNHKDWRNVSLVIDDQDGVLNDERQKYLERARGQRPNTDRFEFSLTLARIRPEMATASLLAQLSDGIPPSITLSPVSIPRRRSLQTQERDKRSLLPPPSQNPVVRTVRPIPQSLLDSLRPKE
ncbi:MAG: hypothetical protein JWN26_774 [Candidatus Saccharibacteria bacterium]|nr:hypothetical protein [Candidatus Saccharibacteria bacterium]